MPVVLNLTKEIPLNWTDYYCSISHTTAWPRELRRKYSKTYHFGGPWVRIQAQTENVSVIFFCADFYTLFLLRNTMGAFINYVDVFLDLFVPLFPLYRIEVALINKIAHCAAGSSIR